MQILWQDLRYAARTFIKAPGFTLIAVLSIALGLAANTSIFTLVNAVLFKPMPVPRPEQLVALYTTEPNSRYPDAFSYPDYRDYRDHNEVFSDLFLHDGTPVSMKNSADKAELIWGELVSGNYFTGLGVTPAAGRVLTPDDDRAEGGHPVAVLSHGFWKQRFGADPNIVGKDVRLNGHDFTVVGVARQGFSGTRFVGFIPDVWIPIAMHNQVVAGSEDWLENRGRQSFNVNGRLKSGVTIEQATAAMNTYAQQLAEAYPKTNANISVGMVPGGSKTQPALTLLGYIPIVAGLMMGIVGLVLLIACANVANLLLARASVRRREIAIRLALGAGRRRLVRQLLTESVLLSLIGGGLGLLLSQWFNAVVPLANPQLDFATIDFSYDLALDHRVVGFTLCLSALTGVIFGLLPALQASRTDLVTVLKGEGPSVTSGTRRLSLRNLLVVAQVALSLMLLISAGLFIRSTRNVQEMNPGFEPKQILLASVDVGLHGYDETKGRNFFKQIVDRVKSLPGVQAASLAGPLPLDAYSNGARLSVEGAMPAYENERLSVNYSIVGPDYFQAMDTPIVEGRGFTEHDDQNAPGVVVVNETMARRFWPNESPIGKRLQLGNALSPFREVAGVAKDGKYFLLGEPPTEYMFVPHSQNYDGKMTLIARTSGEPENLAGALRQEVANLDSELPVYGVKTMPRFLDRILSGPKSIAALATIFGLIALLMAAVGLYGVMSYSVAQRTREVGIRMALGAGRGAVLRLVLKEGLILVCAGIGIGLVAAAAISRLLGSMLYGISATDAGTFVTIPLLLALVALLASYVPARRATKVDPMVALRYE
ncbi:MAG: ABC transporter permease [Acidobacteriota bacterium]